MNLVYYAIIRPAVAFRLPASDSVFSVAIESVAGISLALPSV
jgi:hypothetical protein